ncbi:MAG: hypothetical protein HeimC2_23680 [Candidatus Heimdallarchaeota archaeon LC_2]|nr:MAG: hypothetical protein HeimC2_23680 [Candidatus Heimdallarchaeota archaeon LC_2]
MSKLPANSGSQATVSCSNCGTVNDSQDQFCGYCHSDLYSFKMPTEIKEEPKKFLRFETIFKLLISGAAVVLFSGFFDTGRIDPSNNRFLPAILTGMIIFYILQLFPDRWFSLKGEKRNIIQRFVDDILISIVFIASVGIAWIIFILIFLILDKI